MALFVVLTNISELDDVFKLIFTNAFSVKSLVGGTVGELFLLDLNVNYFQTKPHWVLHASTDTKHLLLKD